jgi:DNA-binding SARP family transcriptional activator
MARLEIRILGPLEAVRDGATVDLGPPRQRAVLAALLIRANEIVPTDVLIDEIWGDAPPERARHSVQVYVANLRRALEPEAGRGASRLLVTRAPGYAIELPADALDAERFQRLVGEGRALAADGDLAGASTAIRSALALWRGPTLADLAYEDFAARESARLEEARTAALEECFAVELALGRHASLVGEIERAVREHRLREGLWGQYILALYRSGRQAEALRAYQDLRSTLREELGVEPSRELRDLEAAVLAQAPELDAPRAANSDTSATVAAAPPEREPSPVDPAPNVEPPLPSVPKRSRRPRVAIALVAAAALIVAIAGVLVANRDHPERAAVERVAYTPRFAVTRCPASFLAAVPGATCGVVSVPEDRSKPNGRWIDLPVTRTPPRKGGTAADPTVAIATRPYPLTSCCHREHIEDQARSPARDHSELIMFGTRISQAPNPRLACPRFNAGPELLSEPIRSPDIARRGQAALRACARKLSAAGISLSHYTFVDAAEDVVDLVRALHLPAVNLTVEGDDSVLAYAVVRDAPAAVRTLTLENPVPGGSSGYSDEPGELGRAWDQYVALCDADPRCAHAYPNLAALLRRDVRQFDEHPRHEKADLLGVRGTVLLDGDHTARALAAALKDRVDAPFVAAVVAEGENGPRLDLVAYAALVFNDYWNTPNFPTGGALSNWCSYTLPAVSPAEAVSDRVLPQFAGMDDGTVQWACAVWPVRAEPETMFSVLSSDVPTLIVEGSLDLYSTPQYVGTIQSGLGHSNVIFFKSLGGNLLDDGVPPCLDDVRRTFLANPSAPLAAATAACSAQSPPIPFVVDAP